MTESNPNLKPSHNVLLIEDDPAYVRLATILLAESELLNCRITHRPTLTAGIQELRQNPNFEVVLLDLTLPDSQGYETLERLLFHFPHLNIIVLTGLDDKDWGLQAVKSGAQDFLVKGAFDGDQLTKSLRYSIERSNILKRLEETQRIAHIGHWECSPAQHHFQASEETYRIFGLSPQRPFSCEELMNPDCPFNIFLQLQDEVCQQEKVEKDIWISRRDGENRYVAIVCSGRKLDKGGFLFNGIIQDITERKQAQELKKDKELAEHAAKFREQFIASVSHEMRTPMNAILGMANLLRQTELDEEQKGYTDSIRQSSDILLGIINDILQMSTIQNGKLQFEQKDFQLSGLLQSLFGVLRYKAEEKKIDFQLVIREDVPKFLKGDVLRLNQILFNLVGNAIKFTDHGFVRLGVEVLEKQVGRFHLGFMIEDSGIGIAEEYLESIFESFTQLWQNGRIYEGTGLGLPIAKFLVEAQGGQIGARSEPGKGSTFFFNLWLDEGEPIVLTEPAPIERIPPEASFDLLLVEDHKMNQLVAKKTLEKKWKNINVFLAENGEEAIQLLKKQKVDIILMDIQMPVRDGLSATEYIRKYLPPEIASIPILAMTAHTDKTREHILKEYGLDDYVLKPFEPEQLFQKIQRYFKPS